MKKGAAYFLVVLLLTINLVMGFCSMRQAARLSGGDAGVVTAIDRLLSILFLTRTSYVDRHTLKTDDLLTSAFQGFSEKLDPFSTYLPPQEFDDLNKMTEGEFCGVGIILHADYEQDYSTKTDSEPKTSSKKSSEPPCPYVKIISVYPNSPAQKAGIKAGDEIRAVNNLEIAPNTNMERVLNLMRGEKGSSMNLSVWRPSEKKRYDLEMTRQQIEMPCVINVVCHPGNPEKKIPSIGYLRLLEFTEPSPEKTKEALQWLLDHGAQAFILDLRNNPGGLIYSSVKICSLFLNPQSTVVTIRQPSYQHLPLEKSERFLRHRVPTDFHFPTQDSVAYPLVVLINENSASASEITAAALQDHKRATIMGEKSFGKGSVQTITPFSDSSGMKLTIARYFPPDRKRKLIDKNGVEPDITVPLSPEEKERQANILNENILNTPSSQSLTKLFPKDTQLLKAIKFLQDSKSAVKSNPPN